MTFQPVVPESGLVGWRYLQSTLDRQVELHSNNPLNLRDTEHFKAKISSVSSAEELVSDRRLLRVALGAFGLQEDINNTAFIQKILEQGTDSSSALANRLSDDRYQKFAEAFGFGNAMGARTAESGFGPRIASKFAISEFEVAVGQKDEDLRLALNAVRQLEEISKKGSSEDTKWYTILGTPPLRRVFEEAFGLPTAFAQIDLEQQVEVMKEKLNQRFGISSLTELSAKNERNVLAERFLLQAQLSDLNKDLSSNSIALQLLDSANAAFTYP